MCAWVAEKYNENFHEKSPLPLFILLPLFLYRFRHSASKMMIHAAYTWDKSHLLFYTLLKKKWDLLRWSNFPAFLGNSNRKSRGIHELRASLREWMQSRFLWILNSIMRSEISFNERRIIFMIVSFQCTQPVQQHNVTFAQISCNSISKKRSSIEIGSYKFLVLIYAFSFHPNDFT